MSDQARQIRLRREVLDHVRSQTIGYGIDQNIEPEEVGFAALVCAYGLLKACGLTMEQMTALLSLLPAVEESGPPEVPVPPAERPS